MADSLTLLELLEQSGTDVYAYDLGRRVGPLVREQFLAFEQATQPYPQPMQRKAWFALVQNAAGHENEPVIWFLRLSLDEQGLLVQAERDYLLNRLLESAKAQSVGADAQAFLQDNPYAFTPRDDRMALFHACLSRDLGLPPSRFYEHALAYFRGEPGWDQWGFVGYQGIADVACRHADAPLSSALPFLPPEPLVALCHNLESQRLSEALSTALLERLQQALQDKPRDPALIAALIRGLAGGLLHTEVRNRLGGILGDPANTHIELLAAVSGRAWELLDDKTCLRAYLERLVDNEHGQAAFNQCVSDLLSLPTLAGTVREQFRDPTLSHRVREAFGTMTGQTPAT